MVLPGFLPFPLKIAQPWIGIGFRRPEGGLRDRAFS